MTTTMIFVVIAFAFLIVSFVMAIIQPGNLTAPQTWALWAIAIIVLARSWFT